MFDMKKFNRRIHMDFHTPDTNSGKQMKDFNAVDYVGVLKRAKVNSLVSFIKCHHGYHYSNTGIGTRHPSLPDNLDMFGEILNECHRQGISVMAYYSVGWISTIQRNKPEWMERNIDGEMQNSLGQPTKGPWANICFNSPYVEEVVLPELEEAIKNYDIDGLWLDIFECQPCYCEHCKRKYKALYSKEMPTESKELKKFVKQTKYDCVEKCRNLLKGIKPDIPMTYNTTQRDEALTLLADFNCLETHPGTPNAKDAWTIGILSYKYLQALEMPWESCTSRFIHGWGGWDDQPTANMMMVCSRILAHGGMINLGDQAYHNGTLDGELYNNIGEVFSFIKTREGYALGHKSFKNAALLMEDMQAIDIYSFYAGGSGNYIAAVNVLTQKHIPFDIVFANNTDKYKDYNIIIIPELDTLSHDHVEALRLYVKYGGKVLLTGSYENEALLKELCGFETIEKSSFSTGYIKVDEKISSGVRRSPLMIPSAVHSIVPQGGALSLAECIYPLIEPNYDDFLVFRHPSFSPPGSSSGKPAFILNKHGRGEIAYCPSNIFTALHKETQWYIKDVVYNVINELLGKDTISISAAVTLECNITQDENNMFIHLINYCVVTGTCHVEEMTPIENVRIEISDGYIDATKKVTLLPDETPLSTVCVEGKTIITVDKGSSYSIIKLPLKKIHEANGYEIH